MARIVVVGAGVLGTMHARAALALGHEVVHLDADLEPRKASVRNFGLVWVSGRAAGAELRFARRSRDLWAEVAQEVPAIGFRPDGSLTIARTDAEASVLRAVAAAPDAGDRGVELLDEAGTRARNPAVRGDLVASMFCRFDAIVEPGAVLPAVRSSLMRRGGYQVLLGRTARRVDPGTVLDHTGARHDGDLVVACMGAAHAGPVAEHLAGAPLRRCRLQMMQTEPDRERLTTALADGDSLRYYPAFSVPELDDLPPPSDLVAAHRIQLLVAQRADGALTIGDTHEYEEPFDFAVDERPYEHLRERASAILGRPIPPIVRRWAGVYSQATDGRPCVRVRPDPRLVVVTGPGGRGMTLAPAIAEETFADLGDVT